MRPRRRAGGAGARVAGVGLLALALWLAALSGAPAAAQAPLVCGKRAIVLDRLAGAPHHEAPVALGLASNGGVIELLVSEGGASWTLILSLPDGTSCLIAAGEGWQSLPVPARLGPPA